MHEPSSGQEQQGVAPEPFGSDAILPQSKKRPVRKEKVITKIAKEVLGIQTLEPQGQDRLDFHDVSVSNIESGLEKAYEAGKTARAQ